MKLTKNVTIVNNLWTWYSIKKNSCVNFRIDVTPPPPVRIRWHFDGPPPPKCELNN